MIEPLLALGACFLLDRDPADVAGRATGAGGAPSLFASSPALLLAAAEVDPPPPTIASSFCAFFASVSSSFCICAVTALRPMSVMMAARVVRACARTSASLSASILKTDSASALPAAADTFDLAPGAAMHLAAHSRFSNRIFAMLALSPISICSQIDSKSTHSLSHSKSNTAWAGSKMFVFFSLSSAHSGGMSSFATGANSRPHPRAKHRTHLSASPTTIRLASRSILVREEATSLVAGEKRREEPEARAASQALLSSNRRS